MQGGIGMKRSIIVHWIICVVLGSTAGFWTVEAILESNLFLGILAILAVIASLLNVACGPDKE